MGPALCKREGGAGTRPFRSAIVLAVLVSLVGCANGMDARGSFRSKEDTAPGTALRLALSAPARAKLGQAVTMQVELSNAGTAAIRFDAPAFPEPLGADVQIRDDQNRVVWRRREGVVPAIAKLLTLEPEEKITFNCTWNGQAPPSSQMGRGIYQVDATLQVGERGTRETLTTGLHLLRLE